MSDISIYPEGIDGYAQLPLAVDEVTRIDAVTVNRLRSAIVNVEAELGLVPSGTFDTVRARLDSLTDPIIGYKNPVRVATTENISSFSSTPLSVDGVTLAVGDRILVLNQTDKSENGIYTVESLGGAWVRTEDANSTETLLPGSETYVVEGDTHSRCKFWLITFAPIVIGVTPLEFLPGVCIMRSDRIPTTVYSENSSSLTEVATDPMDVSGFKEIEWIITIDDKLSATQLDAKIQFTDQVSPSSDNDWAYLQTESISAGLATLSDYVAQKSLADFPGGTVFRIGISAAIRGRQMRLTLFTDSVTGNIEVNAFRRV